MNICNNKMTYQIVRDIRNDAFKKIEILPLKYIDGHPYGEVVSRVIAEGKTPNSFSSREYLGMP